MQELSANKKTSSCKLSEEKKIELNKHFCFFCLVSETNTQPLNEDLDEEIDDEDESTTSSEKPTSRSMTNTSTANKRRAK